MPHTNEAAIEIDWYPLSYEEIGHFDDKDCLIVRDYWTQTQHTN